METGGPRTSNNGLEKSHVLPWRRGCGEKPLCIVTKATSSRLVGWEGGGPERRKREEKGRRLRKGVKGRGSEKEKWEDDKSWSLLLEAEWKSEPLLYYSLHLCLVYAGWISAAWENLQFSVTSSQTKLVSRFFWVRRIRFSPSERKAAQTETLRWLHQWGQFSSPASPNYLTVFHLFSWPPGATPPRPSRLLDITASLL